jgi:hypothetical protein
MTILNYIFGIIAIYFIICLLAYALPDPMNRRMVRKIRNQRKRAQVIHAGSPTKLHFDDKGRIIDENGNEVKPRNMREWVEGVQ